MQQLEVVSALEEKHQRVWTQCQSCQGSLVLEILCTSRSCPIFYARQKVSHDLNEQNNILAKFNEFSNW